MTGFRQLVVVSLLLAFCEVCRPCSVVNWRHKSVAEQAAEAKIIVYGTVRAHYPMPDVPIENAYVAEMDVTCNLKGEVLPARINISEAGELTSCHHTLLPIGGAFITFLERDASSQLVPDEVNYLSVAFPPTTENAYGVGKAVGDLAEKCPQLHSQIGDYTGGDNSAAIGKPGPLICFVAVLIATMMN
ncbi:uncharacterized protein LOC119730432 [Patiria miniata]|uniref:Leishmanolysin-like peptidase n=1 Tax=Patiria miniata TaxID=46514 RepID=A0A914A751_PATMI|nr:uncharacterized protein LOC119730432 [Patiria miniata]XP_038059247.1 uncharacterized protein LOC119730432 [Patiria miniata]XP_038059248.1 uncharacterized protein LOC119730432 [Patiria miniata]